MSIQPLISFKAGRCNEDFDVSPPRIKPLPEQGWLYLYHEDDLVHLCWRGRNASLNDPEIDLVIVPQDATFKPYRGSATSESDEVSSPTSIRGRVFKLAFLSSSSRHFFWLQSAPQHKDKPSVFSERDRRLGWIVDELLNGSELDLGNERNILRRGGGGNGGGDGDTAMDDAADDEHEPSHNRTRSGGAGPDATGGDFRDEGEDSREGGEDGGRAPPRDVQSQTQAAVANFLRSLQSGSSSGAGAPDEASTTLPDLLPTAVTVPVLAALPEHALDELLVHHLPHALIYLALDTDPSEIPAESSSAADDADTAGVLVEGLTLQQKRRVVERVARSPQFAQALASLTGAIRDGGLPGVADALGVEVDNKGYLEGGAVPVGGGKAVEVFVRGVRRTVEKEKKK